MIHYEPDIPAEVDPIEYFKQRGRNQQTPGLLYEYEPTVAGMIQFGAKGISVPDVLEPFQVSLPLYFGATTPRATSEVPHWHPIQAEAYVMMTGKARLLAKHRWDEEWVSHCLEAGDTILVQPEICHYFQWLSQEGLSYVFKGPQVAGVGRAPAGKTTCKFCPHYGNGCVLPEGFTLEVSG